MALLTVANKRAGDKRRGGATPTRGHRRRAAGEEPQVAIRACGLGGLCGPAGSAGRRLRCDTLAAKCQLRRSPRPQYFNYRLALMKPTDSKSKSNSNSNTDSIELRSAEFAHSTGQSGFGSAKSSLLRNRDRENRKTLENRENRENSPFAAI